MWPGPMDWLQGLVSNMDARWVPQQKGPALGTYSSMVIILRSVIILSLNFCFVNVVFWKDGTYPRALEPLHTNGSASSTSLLPSGHSELSTLWPYPEIDRCYSPLLAGASGHECRKIESGQMHLQAAIGHPSWTSRATVHLTDNTIGVCLSPILHPLSPGAVFLILFEITSLLGAWGRGREEGERLGSTSCGVNPVTNGRGTCHPEGCTCMKSQSGGHGARKSLHLLPPAPGLLPPTQLLHKSTALNGK